MNSEIEANSEPLPGYRLVDHLGSGGYGEVWRVEAPGGLTKAIKFVFGKQTEKRATNELRALEHIRRVRHPFLLSLERIEVVDGRLLVVTELADGSVKDRFDACRREGLAGIPRDELLRYLRDAADALDFMSDSHALQHLDIKPENLLLLAGHVKVADFGLVKDMRHSQASLVGGMTPLYAAPEVFRGTPSRHSDQYSLAIVFQEMLTGTLPFAGSNVAELTLQHLNDEPNLSGMSAGDRYVVARALAKEPEHRYGSCREFIEALLQAASASGTTPDEPPASFAEAFVSEPRANVPTDVFDECETGTWDGAAQQMVVELPPADCRLVDLPALDIDESFRHYPTVVIGIGGTGARVLTQLRRRLHERFGEEAALPALQLLLLDTDARTIAEAIRSDEAPLAPDEALHLPLHKPHHYRDKAQQLLSWISRRWLYNIPRSLRTEGLRPLGRLALADHSRHVGQKLRHSIAQATDPTSIATTSQAFRMPLEDGALRVFVVASVSGGTGSGMAIDIGYAARALLEKLRLPHTEICALLTHSTGGDPRFTELARVNSYSLLKELNHFQQPDAAYPGDASCGLPPHRAGVPAFDHSYLVHLGENLSTTEFDEATQSLAEYLMLDLTSEIGAFSDACRRAGNPGGSATGTIRSLGLHSARSLKSEVSEEIAGFISRAVVARWRSAEEAKISLDPTSVIGRIKTATIAAQARSSLERVLGTAPAEFLQHWVEQHPAVALAPEQTSLEWIEQLCGALPSETPEWASMCLAGNALPDIMEPLVTKLRADVRAWLMSRIDSPGPRIAGARDCAAWLETQCRQVAAESSRIRAAIEANLLRHAELVRAAERAGPRDADGRLSPPAIDYFEQRLDVMALVTAEAIAQLIQCDLKQFSDELVALSHEMDQILNVVERSIVDSDAAIVPPNIDLAQLATEADKKLQAEYVAAHGGLYTLVMQGGRPRAQLTAKLLEISRAVAASSASAANGFTSDPIADPESLRSGLALATPSLMVHGGQRRALAILPRGAKLNPERVRQAIGVHCTTIPAPDEVFRLLVEAEAIPLDRVAIECVQRRRDRIEFAERVHARKDIGWAPLLANTTEVPSAPDAFEAGTSEAEMCRTMVM